MKRNYSTKISLVKNSRGVYSLDTSMGCSSGVLNHKNGCYGECFAYKSAKLYGYDFGKTVLRDFVNDYHRKETVKTINKVKSEFIRIGTSGDPSENWNHTFKILNDIKHCNKEIVIITKHWNNMTDEQLRILEKMNVCINTSVSALDNDNLLINALNQYHRIKPYCKSILRIVSANFNIEHPKGKSLNELQDSLFKNLGTLDTILRVNKNNPLVKEGVIAVSKELFLGKITTVSKRKKSIYFDKCSTCRELCGVNIKTDHNYKLKQGVLKQLSIF